MNSDIIAKAELVFDLLLKHDENCQNCCLRDIFENLEGQIPNPGPLNEPKSPDSDNPGDT